MAEWLEAISTTQSLCLESPEAPHAGENQLWFRMYLDEFDFHCSRIDSVMSGGYAPDGNSPIVVELPLDRLEKDRSASDQWGDMGFVSNLLEEAGERSSGRDESCESDVSLGSGRD